MGRKRVKRKKKFQVLTYFTKIFVINRSEKATLLKEYSMMPVMKVVIKKNQNNRW